MNVRRQPECLPSVCGPAKYRAGHLQPAAYAIASWLVLRSMSLTTVANWWLVFRVFALCFPVLACAATFEFRTACVEFKERGITYRMSSFESAAALAEQVL